MKKTRQRILPKMFLLKPQKIEGTTAVVELTRELQGQQEGSWRVPPEAIADLVLLGARLTRLSVPDEDSERTLLLWLSERGFHDVLALKASPQESASRSIHGKRKGWLDLCLWVDRERLIRTAISKDPRKIPRNPQELSREQRACLVQASAAVLEEAKAMNILSYKDLFLLHDQTALAEITKLQRSWNKWWDGDDALLNATANYFGTKIGFYFAWLRFYTMALVPPTLFGLYVWWHESMDLDDTCSSVDRDGEVTLRSPWGTNSVVSSVESLNGWCTWKNYLTPVFNLLLAVWATLFLVFWKRRGHTLAFRWGVDKEDSTERAKQMINWNHRGRFEQDDSDTGAGGRARLSLMRFSSFSRHSKTRGSSGDDSRADGDGDGDRRLGTGARAKAKAKAIARSASRSVALEGGRWEPLRTLRMLVSFSMEVVLLILAIRWMLWFDFLEQHVESVFGKGCLAEDVVRVASVILPLMVFGIHGRWAKATTKWEGHVTGAAAENSMIVKCFTFQCVNSYSRLFYLGFWQRDLGGLEDMLVTVLIVRSFKATVSEVIVPRVSLYLIYFKRKKLKRVGRRSELDFREAEECSVERKESWREALEVENLLPEYEAAGEYLNLIIQYGYVTMFAVAFPLAPLLALVRCLAEIHIDHDKITKCRRPPYINRSGIGAWYGILEIVGVASVLTNCLLLAAATHRMDKLVPVAVAEQFPHAKHLVMAVLVEHIILGLKAGMGMMIDDVPDGVERSMAEEMLADQETSRKTMQEELGIGDDVLATDVTIVRAVPQPTEAIAGTAAVRGMTNGSKFDIADPASTMVYGLTSLGGPNTIANFSSSQHIPPLTPILATEVKNPQNTGEAASEIGADDNPGLGGKGDWDLQSEPGAAGGSMGLHSSVRRRSALHRGVAGLKFGPRRKAQGGGNATLTEAAVEESARGRVGMRTPK